MMDRSDMESVKVSAPATHLNYCGPRVAGGPPTSPPTPGSSASLEKRQVLLTPSPPHLWAWNYIPSPLLTPGPSASFSLAAKWGSFIFKNSDRGKSSYGSSGPSLGPKGRSPEPWPAAVGGTGVSVLRYLPWEGPTSHRACVLPPPAASTSNLADAHGH